MSATSTHPNLHATSLDWHEWITQASTEQLETVRAAHWKIQTTSDCLRDQIQADYVIQEIDWQLDERYEETA